MKKDFDVRVKELQAKLDLFSVLEGSFSSVVTNNNSIHVLFECMFVDWW